MQPYCDIGKESVIVQSSVLSRHFMSKTTSESMRGWHRKSKQHILRKSELSEQNKAQVKICGRRDRRTSQCQSGQTMMMKSCPAQGEKKSKTWNGMMLTEITWDLNFLWKFDRVAL